jgi:ribosome-associated toxin RatA of RatAB toxin-antitoxin module
MWFGRDRPGSPCSVGHLTRSVVVDCPPAQVFDVLARVEHLPEFSPMTVAIRRAPGRPLRTGDRFEQVVRVLGKELQSEWTVVEVDAPFLVRLEGTAPGGATATLVEHLSVEPAGTRVELHVEYDLPLGLLGHAVDAVFLHGENEQQAEEILAGLKELCERST